MLCHRRLRHQHDQDGSIVVVSMSRALVCQRLPRHAATRGGPRFLAQRTSSCSSSLRTAPSWVVGARATAHTTHHTSRARPHLRHADARPPPPPQRRAMPWRPLVYLPVVCRWVACPCDFFCKASAHVPDLVVPASGATTGCALSLIIAVLAWGRSSLTSQSVSLPRDPGDVPEPLKLYNCME